MANRIDVAALKRAVPLAEVIARSGIALRPSGQALVGRCPFHLDRGRPNLYVYPERARWCCYRCGSGGDVISFVQHLEGLDFLGAVERLDGYRRPRATPPVARRVVGASAAPTVASPAPAPGPAELACLETAATLYQWQLRQTPRAGRYLAGRGLSGAVLRDCRVGFACGGTLVGALGAGGRSLPAARRVGLLRPDGREALAGRIVVPALDAGRPVWMIGRLLDPAPRRPKYRGLPGRKPLLGWDAVAGATDVFLTEGPFDLLVLRQWGYPALALLGTHVRPELLRSLARFRHLTLVLDNDPAGQAATAELHRALAPRADPVVLPSGVKDVAELALRPDGRTILARAIQQALPARAA